MRNACVLVPKQSGFAVVLRLRGKGHILRGTWQQTKQWIGRDQVGQTDVRFSSSCGVASAKSKASTAELAAAEIAAQLPSDGLAMILVFLSPRYDPHQFMAEISKHAADAPVYGCS